MSKILASRVKKVLNSLIHTSQTAYMEGRYIGENIRLIDDILTYTDEENISGILLAIDFEKAFDSLNWNFIAETLISFGFGPSFLKWFDLLYKDGKSCVINNGFTTPYFNIERGVRQGDPLSPYLFVLGAEILSLAIRQSKNVEGLVIEDVEIKISQFADDTTLFLKNVESAYEAFKLLNKFEKVSGLKLNTEKCEALWLGPWKQNQEKPLGIKWPQSIKILGIYFSHNKTEQDNMNFGNIASSIAQLTNLWKQKSLTLYGKITISKSLLLSKLTYKASLLSVPTKVVKDISTLVFGFIWNGPDKLKRKTISQDYKFGGLRMFDIDKFVLALKLSWISRIRKSENSPWKMLLNRKLNEVGGFDLFLRSNFCAKQIGSLRVPNFYKELLTSFLVNLRQNKSPHGSQLIWNNCEILIQNKPVYYKSFYKVGMYHIRDLFIKDTALASFKYWVSKGLQPSSYLTWLGLRSAAINLRPQTIRNQAIIGNDNPISKITILSPDKQTIEIKTSFKARNFYTLLINNQGITLPSYSSKWINAFNIQYEELYFYFQLLHDIKADNKTKDLQYRILTGIYNTNVLLTRKRIKNNLLCDFCLKETETVDHFFFNA